jgi:HK97 family phage prohead protease
MSIHTDRLAGRLARTVKRFQALARTGDIQLTDDNLLDNKLSWYRIVNAAGDPTGGDGETNTGPATVYIFDEIGGSMGIDAGQLAKEIDQIDAEEIIVRINSGGGSVTGAVTIHSALLLHPAIVSTSVDGIAASAASVIAMAASPYNEVTDQGGVRMMPGSQMMLHDASMLEDGNAADMAAASVFLSRQSENIAGMYARKAGGTPEEWRQHMLAETWAFADEAVSMGLADKVWAPPVAAGETPELTEAMTRVHDLSRFCYRGRRGAPMRITVEGGSGGNAQVRERVPELPADVDAGPDYAGAAALRGEATERRAHAMAQEGRSVPVMRTSERYRSCLRSLRTDLPEAGPARRAAFTSEMRIAETVTRGGRELTPLHGYASVYGKDSGYEMWDTFGPYVEWVNPYAGKRSLAANPNVMFLANHTGLALARTWNNTLELAEDARGLTDVAYLNASGPNHREDAKLLVQAVMDKEVVEQSFAFMINIGEWSDNFEEFCIRQYDINRGDVSAVNFGANPHTSISARSQQIMADIDRMPIGLARAAYDRLRRRTDVTAARASSNLQVAEFVVRDQSEVSDHRRQLGRRVAAIELLMDDD